MDAQTLLSRLYTSPVARSVLSGLLLGLSFPPSPISSLAFIAFIPFFTVLDAEASGWRMARFTYFFLMVFHATTVYWTGGFTHANDGWMMVSGGGLLLLHPFFLLPFVLAAWYSRRKAGRIIGLIGFVCFWTAFEYFHARGEFSFPWISVGNSQANDILRIQMAEFTSVQGLTLHLLAFNVLAYLALMEVAEGRWPASRGRTFGLAAAMITVYVAPLLWGSLRMDDVDRGNVLPPTRVGIVQPDVDPWEKWGMNSTDKWTSYERQMLLLDSLTRTLFSERPDLVVWPETAIPVWMLLPGYRSYLDHVKSVARDAEATVMTGLPHVLFFAKSEAPVTAKPIAGSDTYYESYNSATLIDPSGNVGPVYKKVILVPFAERLPYAETFRFLIEPLKWGVGISSWGMGKDTTVYTVGTRAGDSVRLSVMICYESVYPNYVREFTRKGAQVLTVITNDSWWDRTSGAYQHVAFASIRAAENRRWIVQCANGGVSAIVDPNGRIVRRSRLYERAAWVGVVIPRTDETFYVRHGDVVGLVNLFGAGVLSMFVAFKRLGRGR